MSDNNTPPYPRNQVVDLRSGQSTPAYYKRFGDDYTRLKYEAFCREKVKDLPTHVLAIVAPKQGFNCHNLGDVIPTERCITLKELTPLRLEHFTGADLPAPKRLRRCLDAGVVVLNPNFDEEAPVPEGAFKCFENSLTDYQMRKLRRHRGELPPKGAAKKKEQGATND